MDTASGAFRPRAPTAYEALLAERSRAARARLDRGELEVCHAGACRRLAVPEEDGGDTINEGESLHRGQPRRAPRGGDPRGGQREEPRASPYAAVYDVAAGRRIRQIALSEEHRSMNLLGETLVATAAGCDQPCPPSVLLRRAHGQRLAVLDGRSGWGRYIRDR